MGSEDHENEPMVAQNKMRGKSRGAENSRGQLAECQESCGGHSWLHLKLWVTQAVGRGGANHHVLGMKPSVVAPVTREAKAKLE